MKQGIPHSALSLGISPCPNDTFIFDAWVNGKLGHTAPAVTCHIADIAVLNDMALRGILDVVKVSAYAYGYVQDTYKLVHAGGAMGRGCGPLIVARSRLIDRTALADPANTIAVPGTLTTANALLCLYQPAAHNRIVMPFDQIMPAVARGDVAAGVIIHEGRFTFMRYGLEMIEDLGAWWESTTGYPVPLGVIVVKRSLGTATAAVVQTTIRASLQMALDNPDHPRAFMQQHAAELDPEIMQQHVELYVNQYTLDLGDEGLRALEYFLSCLRAQRLLA